MSTEISMAARPTAITETNHGSSEFAGLVSMGDQLRRTGFLPSHIKDGVSFAAIVLMGRELGMGTMAACRKLQVIKGTVTERADSQLARFKSAGGRAVFKELNEAKAVLSLRHPNGDEHVETFTIDDARRAGLASNDNYAKHPKAMLRSRAITAGLKSIGWEGAVGIYDPDEIRSEDLPENVKSVEQAGSVTVAHMKTFAPQPSVVKLRPDATSPADDPVGKARLAVSKAASLEQLDRVRALIGTRGEDGTFTAEQVAELVQLCHHRAEMLIGEDEKGEEFAHEAAEHEVTA